MRTAAIILSMFIGLSAFAQEIPAVHRNLGMEDGRLYVQEADQKIFAAPTGDEFKFTDLYGHVVGTEKGLQFDFKYPALKGTLYYGFINYGDARHPQPVLFKRTAEIKGGRAFINIRDKLSGKYDMIGWQDSGQGTLGYRITDAQGQIIYDGKASFRYDGNSFHSLPTLIEGPFVDLITANSAVISFNTTKAVESEVIVDGRHFSYPGKSRHHEIMIDGLEPATEYEYTVKYGKLSLDFAFTTAPQAGNRRPFTFAYASDSRAGQGGGERNILGTNAYIMKKIAALATAENAAFLQFTGDLVNGYENSRERMQLQYANWKHAIEPFAHYMPVYEGFGNHESFAHIFPGDDKEPKYMIDHFPYENNSGESLFRENFVNPSGSLQSEDGSKYDPDPEKMDFPSYEETVFRYQYDNVAMVVLNSDYWYAPDNHQYTGGNLHAFIMDNQLQWLESTLQKLEADAGIDHIFITLHTPFFPNGGHVDDDMWYGGSNDPRPAVAETEYEVGIIQRRDQLLDLIVNQSGKTLALLTGDEHNYNLLHITNEMERYPRDYPHEKLELKRDFYQINNGAAGAPYYAREKTPWMDNVNGFSTQNALVLIDVEGPKVKVRVKNPDTLEEITAYILR